MADYRPEHAYPSLNEPHDYSNEGKPAHKYDYQGKMIDVEGEFKKRQQAEKKTKALSLLDELTRANASEDRVAEATEYEPIMNDPASDPKPIIAPQEPTGSRGPASSGSFDMNPLLIGGAGMLGALLGGGDASEGALAGKEGIEGYQKQQNFEATRKDKLNTYLAKKKSASDVKHQKFKYKDEQGRSRWGNFNPITKKYETNPNDLIAESRMSGEEYGGRVMDRENSARRMGKDKKYARDEEGRLVAIDKPTGNITRLQDNQYSPKQKEGLLRLSKEFSSDKQVQSNREMLGKADDIRKFIKNGNPISVEVAKFMLARTAQGTGVLSDNDVKAVAGSRASFTDRMDQAMEQFTAGQLTEKSANFLLEVVSIMEESSATELETAIQSFTESKESGLDMEAKDIRKSLSVPELKTENARKIKRNQKLDNILDNMTEEEMSDLLRED